MSGPGRVAAFVDRDGVVNELVTDPVSGLPESPLHPEQVRLLPAAAEAISRLAAGGLLVVCVTNQPAAAKQKVSVAELEAVQARVESLLADSGARFDQSRMCLHHPEGVDPALAGRCPCRKPSPGMLLDAAASLGIDLARSWMIGDTDADVGAGRRAGCSTVLVTTPASAHKRLGGTVADFSAPGLLEAAIVVLSEDPTARLAGRA